jgi:adenylate cyclase
MSSVRRLTAILAADVAGYSRLMGADEEGTHERLKAHLRELVEPKIKEHRGRIVKNTGDGLLAEFASVVDAVRCAAQVQRVMADRNAETPEDKRITFRIGVNLGDVIAEEDDIYGDGVNVAARLEALAEPGASASREWYETRSETSCPIRSKIGENKASRTSPGRCGSMHYAPKPLPNYRWRVCQSQCRAAGAALLRQ